ncbi:MULTISPECIES: efflux RND transporter permease subunit [unclassified Duganella]|uniref:efflux RND transporter permease subunit n=1 Tax=unclassified Duganella TaxID=2636909 RepID=UPI000E340DCF|nr:MULTISPECIES: efflux RND transporter permease subunit [unclassified Duganella]RFP16205.1 efflux RND transporter permease subunit [Duganella sp. BJB475]RFP32633.1 efflux RND transporter permease subunit [Duganella sp. BJB476]
MNFSTLSIKHPLPAIMLFILLSIAGLFGFHNMTVQDRPDIELPFVAIDLGLPGASPSQLETEVARKVEGAVAGIQDVRHIYTTVSDGNVNITIVFRLEKNLEQAMSEARDAVNRVRSDLPAEVRDPVFTKASTSGGAILGYALSSSRLDEEALSWYVDSVVSKALLAVKGVGKVERLGGVTREVLVELDPARLSALNVSAADVSRQLQRVQREAAGGRTDVSGAQQSVRIVGTVANAAGIAALELPLPNGHAIRLDQLARVSDGIAERETISLLDGKPVVGFEITRSKGAGEVEVAAAVRQAVRALRERDTQVDIKEVRNSVDVVEENYASSMDMLYEGAVLAVLVVWLFLRDWRATVISATALPLSVIPTFLVMWLLGFTLNGITLLSLTLVIGILVDDAIVEIENIVRHLRMGKTPYQAAMEAANEIGLAVVATTLTLVAVFLPTAFMRGIVGKFFRQFGWTAAVAVLASLMVARLLTPMMAAYLLKPIAAQPRDSRMMTRYLAAASWCLRHRRLTCGLSGAFFLLSLALIPLLETDFIPAANGARTQVTLELPPGSTLADTRALAEQARQLLRRDPDTREVMSNIERNVATLNVTLTPRAARSRKQGEIEASLRETLGALPGARVKIGGGGNGSELALLLSGDDTAVLGALTQQLQREIRAIPGLGGISSSINLVRPEVIVTPDVARAADLGVTTTAIGETMRIATAGDYDQALAKLNLPERQIAIRTRFPASARQDLELLARLPVPGKNGNVQLGSVATLQVGSGPARIDRLDRNRRVIVHVELNGQPMGAILDRVNALPSLQKLPPGVTRGQLDDAEAMQDLFTGFGLAILTGVLCVYVVLVLLFHGFLQPVTILAALPLSVGGAFLALLLTRSAFSMPSLIGLLMLMGVAVKNSILLVEYAIVARRDHGMERGAALMDACHKRARPIVMTTIAMGAGMLPIALGLGGDASFRGPMAIAVIGGLITSTFLSLLVIPVVFTYVDDLLQWCGRRFAGGRRATVVAEIAA